MSKQKILMVVALCFVFMGTVAVGLIELLDESALTR